MTPPTEWLREQLGSAWWRRLPDRHFRLLFNLMALAVDQGDGTLRAEAELDDLVALRAGSRTTIYHALVDLAERGVCRIATSPGRKRVIAILPPYPAPVSDTGTEEPAGAAIIPLFPAKSLDTPTRDRDQDLQRSGMPVTSEKRLVSDHQRKETRPPVKTVTGRREEGTLREGTGHDLHDAPCAGPGRPRGERSSETTRSPGGGHDGAQSTLPWPAEYRDLAPPRPEGRAGRIPDRAWKAADYLREQLLELEPSCAVSRDAWEPTTGRRLEWADGFRLINERDEREWDEIARTVHWLFHGQDCEKRYRIEVESPKTLRDKWDQIQRARRRQQESAGARRADGRPDPHANRPTKTWTGGE